MYVRQVLPLSLVHEMSSQCPIVKQLVHLFSWLWPEYLREATQLTFWVYFGEVQRGPVPHSKGDGMELLAVGACVDRETKWDCKHQSHQSIMTYSYQLGPLSKDAHSLLKWCHPPGNSLQETFQVQIYQFKSHGLLVSLSVHFHSFGLEIFYSWQVLFFLIKGKSVVKIAAALTW